MQRLTVLHINKFHYLKGGSEVVYFQTAQVLESHGHKSLFFSMYHPENFPCETAEYFVPYVDFNKEEGIMRDTGKSLRILYYFKANKLLSNLLDKYEVDIAHLHNIHHQISPSILHVLKRRGIPIVMTLHDYKMVCASYNLLVQERPCEICVRGNYYKAVKYRCMKDSFTKSVLAAIEMYLHHRIMDIYKNVDIFIAPSLFLKNKLIEMGFKKYIEYLPNFIDMNRFTEFDKKTEQAGEERGSSFVYFGRLTPGKGLLTLIETANLLHNKDKGAEVKIIGDGPLRKILEDAVRDTAIDNVRFLGYLGREKLFNEVKKSIAVIIPSEWYENNPMAVIEAFAMGKPVIGSRIAGIPELVKDGETGLTFEPQNPKDLCAKIEYLRNNPDKAKVMGENARLFVERELNAEKYYRNLIEIYKYAISKRKFRSKA